MPRFQNNDFPLKLKMLRLEAGKSQEEFSSELGISRSSLANYETGKRQPDNQMISRIADVCNVMTDFFLERPMYANASCQERSADKTEKENQTKRLKALIQNRGNSLDISHLSVEHRISIIEYYEYILSHQKREESEVG